MNPGVGSEPVLFRYDQTHQKKGLSLPPALTAYISTYLPSLLVFVLPASVIPVATVAGMGTDRIRELGQDLATLLQTSYKLPNVRVRC